MKPGDQRRELAVRGKHPAATLTASQVRTIRKGGKTDVFFARKYGVTPTTISNVRRGFTWKHLK